MVARTAGAVRSQVQILLLRFLGRGTAAERSVWRLKKEREPYIAVSLFFFAEYFAQKSVVLEKERHRKTRQNQFMILRVL